MLPNSVMKTPSLVNFCTRLLSVSGTKTLPLGSTANSSGLLNCPAATPELPQVVRKVPQGSAGVAVAPSMFVAVGVGMAVAVDAAVAVAVGVEVGDAEAIGVGVAVAPVGVSVAE